MVILGVSKRCIVDGMVTITFLQFSIARTHQGYYFRAKEGCMIILREYEFANTYQTMFVGDEVMLPNGLEWLETSAFLIAKSGNL
ncbi:MAG: hypothetical protein MZV49_21330 [Rhodopseudomonas palustris]|nr:hypothetical protein [Rhodopseudomonas palustris]